MYRTMTITFIVGLIGAFIFSVIGLPMPWLLGPLFFVLITQLKAPISLTWHPFFRNIGLVIAGYVIGYAFTLEALQQMIHFFPLMIAINVLFFLLFLVISFVLSRLSKMNLGTAMTCCVPGGLQQVIVFAEEQKEMDVTLVTFYHVLRVLVIVSMVPFIVSIQGPNLPVETSQSEKYSFILLGLMIVAYFVGMLFKLIKVPTAYLLGPVFFVMVCNLVGWQVPMMPDSALHIAQLFIGIYIGLLLKRDSIKKMNKQWMYALLSCVIFVSFALGISWFVKQAYFDFSTSFLSVVPGGLDQMGIIAASVQADVMIVTAFQLFRILFLSALVIPFVQYVVRNKRRNYRAEHDSKEVK
ncbi:AbrB family transcriptional regulator [Oceanobacillus iheyensis]|nr:AbrB family transcriptional regulator [Oceanobacillus iheyensis]